MHVTSSLAETLLTDSVVSKLQQVDVTAWSFMVWIRIGSVQILSTFHIMYRRSTDDRTATEETHAPDVQINAHFYKPALTCMVPARASTTADAHCCTSQQAINMGNHTSQQATNVGNQQPTEIPSTPVANAVAAPPLPQQPSHHPQLEGDSSVALGHAEQQQEPLVIPQQQSAPEQSREENTPQLAEQPGQPQHGVAAADTEHECQQHFQCLQSMQCPIDAEHTQQAIGNSPQQSCHRSHMAGTGSVQSVVPTGTPTSPDELTKSSAAQGNVQGRADLNDAVAVVQHVSSCMLSPVGGVC